MDKTRGDVDEHIAQITPAPRQRDAETLLAVMREVTGREPEMWSGGIIGFGSCHYRYPTGTEGDMPIVAFSPRKTSTTIYVDDTAAHTEALAELGPHTTGRTCLYIKDLAKVDAGALRRIVTDSYTHTIEAAEQSAGGRAGAGGATEITITG